MAKIQPRNNNGSILLRWKHKGQQYTLSGFGQYTDRLALSRAEQVAIQLQMDISSNNFDSTLEKYGKVKVQPVANPELLKDKPLPLPSEAIGSYYTYRAKLNDCSNANLKSINLAYKVFRAIELDGYKEPPTLVNEMVKRSGYNSIKKHWCFLNMAFDWLELNGKIAQNPYKGLRRLLPTKKIKEETSEDDWQIDPFSTDERESILRWFKNHSRYSYLYPLIEFLFFIGCRPSEAIVLRYGAIANGKITFSETHTAYDNRKRLKTQKSRVVNIPEQLQYLTTAKGELDSLIFPAKRGGVLQWDAFRRNQWSECLDELGIRYRKPYQMRHTFITEAIKKGISSTLIARHCGNSTEMIERHYLGDTSDVSISL